MNVEFYKIQIKEIINKNRYKTNNKHDKEWDNFVITKRKRKYKKGNMHGNKFFLVK